MTGMLKCVVCGGTKELPCTRCRMPASRDMERHAKICEGCKRRGKIECPACGGTGKARPDRGVAAP
jgi:primosomal protein N'